MSSILSESKKRITNVAFLCENTLKKNKNQPKEIDVLKDRIINTSRDVHKGLMDRVWISYELMALGTALKAYGDFIQRKKKQSLESQGND